MSESGYGRTIGPNPVELRVMSGGHAARKVGRASFVWWTVGALIDGTGPERIPLVGIPFEQGPQVTHRIGPVVAPTHPAPLQSLVDHRLARRLDVTRADLPARGYVPRVVHPVHVVAD